MKFSEIKYERPNLPQLAAQLEALAGDAAAAQNGGALVAVYQKACDLSDAADTAAVVASIRHTVDTRDAFYDAENDYIDEQGPVVADKTLVLYRALLASPHKDALAQKYGAILPRKLELAVKQSDERLIALQQEDNALSTRYQKLYASARIPFMGKELNIPQLTPYKQDSNRDTRKAAYAADGGFFDSHREELDEIYAKMVKNRTQQAKTLGYNTFTPLGDIRMQRLGYTRADIRACRDAVAKDIVPIVQKLKAAQARRIGVADFSFWDDLYCFPDGNPTPKGTPEEILAAGQQMYQSLSPETAQFINFMMESDLFDVLSKPGKAPGGYCTYIPGHKAPFIFSNFNGTAGDVDVLTHEAGHAFADYVAAQKNLPDLLRHAGYECCEIHSMSMEFLTGGYHHLFFKEDTQKYAVSHAEDALFFLPYGCMVDEFQEEVYENPGLTPEQRNQLWLGLERKYRPWVNFGGLPLYGRGGGWQRQLHIYEHVFYYIDYVLAQTVALQFFVEHNRDEKAAWQKYLALVNKAGAAGYTDLVHAAGLKTPFEPGALKAAGEATLAWLEENM